MLCISQMLNFNMLAKKHLRNWPPMPWLGANVTAHGLHFVRARKHNGIAEIRKHQFCNGTFAFLATNSSKVLNLNKRNLEGWCHSHVAATRPCKFIEQETSWFGFIQGQHSARASSAFGSTCTRVFCSRFVPVCSTAVTVAPEDPRWLQFVPSKTKAV